MKVANCKYDWWLLVFLVACLILFVFFTSGCQNWPKDAYIQDAKSTVNTPWGPSTLEAGIIATGKAAANISLPDTVDASNKSKSTKKATP